MGAGDAGERDVDDRHAVAALRRLHHRSAGLPRRRSGQGRQPLQQSARRHPGQDQTPRYAESDRVCPILLSNTVFYWVLPGFYCVLRGFFTSSWRRPDPRGTPSWTEFYPSLIPLHQVLLGFTEFFLGLGHFH